MRIRISTSSGVKSRTFMFGPTYPVSEFRGTKVKWGLSGVRLEVGKHGGISKELWDPQVGHEIWLLHGL